MFKSPNPHANVGRFHTLAHLGLVTTIGRGGYEIGDILPIEKSYFSLGTFDDFREMHEAVFTRVKDIDSNESFHRSSRIEHLLVIDNLTHGTYAFDYVKGQIEDMKAKFKELGNRIIEKNRFEIEFQYESDFLNIKKETYVTDSLKDLINELEAASKAAKGDVRDFVLGTFLNKTGKSQAYLLVEFVTPNQFYLSVCEDIDTSTRPYKTRNRNRIKRMNIQDKMPASPVMVRMDIEKDQLPGDSLFSKKAFIAAVNSAMAATPTMWKLPHNEWDHKPLSQL